jgi:hypothetical protein
LKNLYEMQSKIAIHVYYALYEITYLQYMFVVYLFYYAFTLIWPFYIKINMHKKNSYILIFLYAIHVKRDNFAMLHILLCNIYVYKYCLRVYKAKLNCYSFYIFVFAIFEI